VNLDGAVVGMNTAIFSRSGGYMGVGFAIPINLANAIANQLIEQGEVTRGYPRHRHPAPDRGSGRILRDAAGRGDPDRRGLGRQPGGKAGLRQGDVIVAYRGEPVTDVGNFRNRVALTTPGSSQELTIVRDGSAKTSASPSGPWTPDAARILRTPPKPATSLGSPCRPSRRSSPSNSAVQPGEGVLVTEVKPGSVAASAGIEPGPLILQVNRQWVKSVSEFQQAVKAGRETGRVLLLLRKDDMQRFVVLSW
jgi:serine protease Do